MTVEPIQNALEIIHGGVQSMAELWGFDVSKSERDFEYSDDLLTMGVRIFGAWEGLVAVTCRRELARAMAAKIFDESEVDETMLLDTLGELGNVIGGNILESVPAPSMISVPKTNPGGLASLPVLSQRAESRACYEIEGMLLQVFIAEYPSQRHPSMIWLDVQDGEWQAEVQEVLAKQGHDVEGGLAAADAATAWAAPYGEDDKPHLMVVDLPAPQETENALSSVSSAVKSFADEHKRGPYLLGLVQEEISNPSVGGIEVSVQLARKGGVAEALEEINRIARRAGRGGALLSVRQPASMWTEKKQWNGTLTGLGLFGGEITISGGEVPEIGSRLKLRIRAFSGYLEIDAIVRETQRRGLFSRKRILFIDFVRKDATLVRELDAALSELQRLALLQQEAVARLGQSI
jgi:hypothetical protein